MVSLLVLSNINQAYCINLDHACIQSIIIVNLTNGEMTRQKTNLAHHCVVADNIHCNDILLARFAVKQQHLLLKPHLRSGLNLFTTNIMGVTLLSLVTNLDANDINHSTNLPLDYMPFQTAISIQPIQRVTALLCLTLPGLVPTQCKLSCPLPSFFEAIVTS